MDYIRIIRNKITFKSKGFAYVKFESKDSVNKALVVQEKFKERQLRVSKAKKMKLNNKKE